MSEKWIQPTYYVRHPDDTYSVADPQPRFIPEPREIIVSRSGEEIGRFTLDSSPSRSQIIDWAEIPPAESKRVESGGGASEDASELSSPPVGVDLPAASQPACQFDSQANNTTIEAQVELLKERLLEADAEIERNLNAWYIDETIAPDQTVRATLSRTIKRADDAEAEVERLKKELVRAASPPVAPKEKL